MDDLFAVLASERLRLADALDQLTPDEWARPSLCAGWSNHVVAAHLNLPWTLRPAAFALGFVRARGNADVAMDRASRKVAEGLDPKACVALLRANAGSRRTPPGLGIAAPLTDVVVHGADILRPLGRAVAVSPEALRCALGLVVSRVGVRGFGARSVEGLRLRADDVDCTVGSGPEEVTGPALSLCGAVLGRADHLPDLAGDGLGRLAGTAR